MARLQLDDTNRRILDELRTNARITNVALAQRVGISPPPCLRRLRALERSGIIRGYYADVDPRALGLAVIALASIGLVDRSDAERDAFEAKVALWPEARACYQLSGEFDFLLEIAAADLARFHRFVNEELARASNVESVQTVMVTRLTRFIGAPPPTAAAAAAAEAAEETRRTEAAEEERRTAAAEAAEVAAAEQAAEEERRTAAAAAAEGEAQAEEEQAATAAATAAAARAAKTEAGGPPNHRDADDRAAPGAISASAKTCGGDG